MQVLVRQPCIVVCSSSDFYILHPVSSHRVLKRLIQGRDLIKWFQLLERILFLRVKLALASREGGGGGREAAVKAVGTAGRAQVSADQPLSLLLSDNASDEKGKACRRRGMKIL